MEYSVSDKRQCGENPFLASFQTYLVLHSLTLLQVPKFRLEVPQVVRDMKLVWEWVWTSLLHALNGPRPDFEVLLHRDVSTRSSIR